MASTQFFQFTGNELILNIPEILLVREFDSLLKYGNNIGPKVSFQYFKYIWLAFNELSPYQNHSEEVRLNTSMEDCNFTLEDIEFPIMEMAIFKYRKIHDTELILMLRSAKNAVAKIRMYFDALDLNATDDKGRFKYNATQVIGQFKGLGQIYGGLSDLEKLVKEERNVSNGIRGDNEVGFNN